jgi:ferredoxin
LCFAAPRLWAENRVVERFPAPDFHSGYVLPQTQQPPTPWQGQAVVDVVLLAAALGLSVWAVFVKRSRKIVVAISVGCLFYFGFWRKGCICPVGSIQNVALAAGGTGYALPWPVAVYFLLPLLFCLFWGRVFCAGVCPLGAAQDLVLFKPLQLPAWLEKSLGLFAWAYLGLAVLLAATGSDFVICRYDPFVSFFRRSGTMQMLIVGGIFVGTSMFVGRAYCRFFCPYGILLRLLAPLSRRQVSITPTHCTNCRLCEKSCAFGAIRIPAAPRLITAPRAPRVVAACWAGVLLLAAILAFLGYRAAPTIARMDFTVRLADQIHREEIARTPNTSDETRNFRSGGQTIAQLDAQAGAIEKRFANGSPILGAFLGLVIGAVLAAALLRKGRSEFQADPAACVACTRCFSWCPEEAPAA